MKLSNLAFFGLALPVIAAPLGSTDVAESASLTARGNILGSITGGLGNGAGSGNGNGAAQVPEQVRAQVQGLAQVQAIKLETGMATETA